MRWYGVVENTENISQKYIFYCILYWIQERYLNEEKYSGYKINHAIFRIKIIKKHLGSNHDTSQII